MLTFSNLILLLCLDHYLGIIRRRIQKHHIIIFSDQVLGLLNQLRLVKVCQWDKIVIKEFRDVITLLTRATFYRSRSSTTRQPELSSCQPPASHIKHKGQISYLQQSFFYLHLHQRTLIQLPCLHSCIMDIIGVGLGLLSCRQFVLEGFIDSALL